MAWHLSRSTDGDKVVISFEGKLLTADGAASAAAFAEELRRGPTRAVWDLRKMTGYETGARIAWQNALWPLRRNILGIEVIGGSALVQIGAITLTSLLGVTATFSGGGRRR